MNSLLQLLLFSTAAGCSMKNIRKSPKHSLSIKNNHSSFNRLSAMPESDATTFNASTPTEEIPKSKLLAALNAADEAVNINPYATGPFSLPALDYDYNALEPYIDEATMRVHHLGHHQAYVTGLNAALLRHPEYYDLTLNELLLFPDRLPGDIYTQINNNAGGDYNHSLMWKIIGPPHENRPEGALATAIDEQFGSFDNLQDAMMAASLSVFGSGYSYLVLNPYGRLLVITTSNQTTPIPLRSIPLLPLDVWEHAYYLKHENKRGDYIKDYFQVINWNQVGKRYEAALEELKRPIDLADNVAADPS